MFAMSGTWTLPKAVVANVQPSDRVQYASMFCCVARCDHSHASRWCPKNLPKSQIVAYRSADGTPISAILTMPFNPKRDGSNPHL